MIFLISFTNHNFLSSYSDIFYYVERKTPKTQKNLVFEDQKLNLVRGQRGKPLLSWCGFLFAQNNKTADSIYWCCRTKTREEKACRARITTSLKPNGLYRINVTQPTHNHEQTNRIIKKLSTSEVSEEV